MKLAIIGAGASGLVTLKYALDDGHECDVYEQTGDIGGVWVYHEEIVDKNGQPIASPMYKNLWTNLPKETMAFLDFPYLEQTTSFISHTQVLDYFRRYSNHYGLENHIKFYNRVIQVKLVSNEKWNVTIQNVNTKQEETKLYDAVFVCNGHFSAPNLPQISGQKVFKGSQFHCIFFRRSEVYKDKRVLVVGGASSAIDITRILTEATKHVYISHRGEFFLKPAAGVIKKPAILRLEEDGVEFVDGTKERIDVIIYCTGYNFHIPFLTEDCGIRIEKEWVQPLYKHVVNIKHPTMYFIGLPSGLCVVPMFDIQARFALAALKKHFTLPTQEAMMMELDDYISKLPQKNGQVYPHRLMAPNLQGKYFQELATTAGIRPIPAVVSKIYELVKYNKDLTQCFKIVDCDNFIASKCKQ